MLALFAKSFLGFCLINFVIVVCLLSGQTINAIAFDEVSSLHVWLTVSSLARKDPNNNKALLFRQIELNWINAPNEDASDYIGLYLDNEPDGGSLPVSVHRIGGRLSGQFTTDYYLPQIDFFNETGDVRSSSQAQTDELSAREPAEPDNQFQEASRRPAINDWLGHGSGGRPLLAGATNLDRRRAANDDERRLTGAGGPHLAAACLGYCLAYHSRERILAKNCLRLQPTWMQDQFQFIGARALPTLMLPGTHNSATYPRQLDKSVLQMINKYQMNQDESIFNQLLFGVRHLDLRVGFSKVKNRPERLWIYHDIFRTDVSLDEVLEQVRRFLELTSHEIIVMDFHRFTVGFLNEPAGTQRERHAKLIDLLFDRLGKYIVPSYLGQHAPLQEYVNLGKRLIVGYADRQQLLGSAQVEHSVFALYTDSGRKPVRDIDAAKQDQDEQLNGLNLTSNWLRKPEHSTDGQQASTDRRVGTRIYNRLKSLRLISHSFSKRSVENNDIQLVPLSHGQRRPTVTSSGDSELVSAGDERPLQLLAQPDESRSATPPPPTDQSAGGSVSRVALLFAPVRHLWPNKDTLEGLAQYMNETTCRKYFGELRSMMVELTPTVFGAISDKYDGNRRLAQSVNRHVTDWIRDRWLHCVNIVASDYFLGNDLIQLSIYANKMRALTRNVELTNKVISNQMQRQCKSMRKIEHLLDKSKIPPQFAFHDLDAALPGGDSQQNELFNHQSSHRFNQRNPLARGGGAPSRPSASSDHFITHINSNGRRILIEPLNQGSAGSSTNLRERRHSFVDNVSEGFSDLFSSFKRLLNL